MWQTQINSLMGVTAICPPTIPDGIIEKWDDEDDLEKKSNNWRVRIYKSWNDEIYEALHSLKGFASSKQIAAVLNKSDSQTLKHLHRMQDEGLIKSNLEIDNGRREYWWYAL